MVLDDEHKSILRFNIHTFRPDLWPQFSQQQRWAFNAAGVRIPIREESGAGGPAVYHVLRSESDSGCRLHISGPAANRWYCIVKGRGFTGIARGASISVAATAGVPHAFSMKCASKAEAEYRWLQHHDQGDTEILSDPAVVRPPARPPTIASAPRSGKAAHVYDLESDSDSNLPPVKTIRKVDTIDLTRDEDTVDASEEEGGMDED
jgi:hypothetical protein